MPAIVRDALVDECCLHDPLKPRVKADRANHDCLIRIYLGRKKEVRTSGAPRQLWFALRNFKMDLQRLNDLDIETTTFARSMAVALAVMHWHSNLDARDVECVLGGLPAQTQQLKPADAGISGKECSLFLPSTERPEQMVSLWLLDFNQCRKISMDQLGIDEAVDAFCVNDACYPRPNVDEHLWIVFCDAYRFASEEITKGTQHFSLPGLSIQGVVARLADKGKGGQ